MDNLARERVFEELCKLILLVQPEDLIRFAPVLTQVIPELAPLVALNSTPCTMSTISIPTLPM
jgi:hypothetical protein